MKLVDMIFPRRKPHAEEPRELRLARVESRATLRRVDRVLQDFEQFERDVTPREAK